MLAERAINLVVFLGVLALVLVTMVQLKRLSSKSFCQTKNMINLTILAMNAVALVGVVVCYSLGQIMGAQYPYTRVGQAFISLSSLIVVPAMLSIATTWVHVAANAKVRPGSPRVHMSHALYRMHYDLSRKPWSYAALHVRDLLRVSHTPCLLTRFTPLRLRSSLLAQAFRRITPKAVRLRAMLFALIFGTIVCVGIIVMFTLGKNTYAGYVSAAAALILMVCFFVASRTLGNVLRARSASEKKAKAPPVNGHLQVITSSSKWLGLALCGHLVGVAMFAVVPDDTVWQYVGDFFLFFFIGFGVFTMTRYYRMAMLTRAARLSALKSRADRRNKNTKSTASVVPEMGTATNTKQDGGASSASHTMEEETGEEVVKAVPQQAWGTTAQ
jgi:hypothetical protein